MMKRISPYVLSSEQNDESRLAGWVFDSHNWNEYAPGYYKCLWCGATHTSTMSISPAYPLCRKNPALIAQTTMKETQS